MSTKNLFDKQKSDCFAKCDLSRKGSIDQPIIKIIETFNQHQDYFSLSSCSGRIVVLREGGSNQSKSGNVDNDINAGENNLSTVVKSGCAWIHVAHEPVVPKDVIAILDNYKSDCATAAAAPGCVVIKFEPLVLHIQCRDVDAAKLVHTASVEAGFRNSGITLGRAGKTVAAVRSTHGLEVPISDENGKLLVSSEYLEFVLAKANTKLEDNFNKISKFEEKLIFYLNKEKSDKRKKPRTESKINGEPRMKKDNKENKVNCETQLESDFYDLELMGY